MVRDVDARKVKVPTSDSLAQHRFPASISLFDDAPSLRQIATQEDTPVFPKISLFGLKPVSQRTLLSCAHYKYPAHVAAPLALFTEFISLHFRPDLKFEDNYTVKGKTFAKTIQALAECQNIRRFWWGRVAEDPDVVKVLVGPYRINSLLFIVSALIRIIDWITSEDNDVFHTSPSYSQIGTALERHLQKPATSILFDIGDERHGFGDTHDMFHKTTAFYQLYLPIGYLDKRIEGSSTCLVSPVYLLTTQATRLFSDHNGIGGNTAGFAFSLEAVPY